MRRWLTCILTLLSLVFVGAAHAAPPPEPPAPLGHTLRVPLDYSRPQAGTAELYYEFGAPFDARKPTVILVADGRQYFVQKGSVAALHRVKAEVFILAGRDDEAVDYRTTIALAYAYPNHDLFIADDNHNFLKLAGAGGDARLLQAFYEHGLGSAELAAAIVAEEPYRWRE